MGDINGAMIIAPMIAGALSIIRPSVAIVPLRNINSRNVVLGREFSRIKDCISSSAARSIIVTLPYAMVANPMQP